MKTKLPYLAIWLSMILSAQRIPTSAVGTVYRADSSVTATLPSASAILSGQSIEVMCVSTANCTVASAGGLIGGGTSFTVASGITVRFVSDGSGWWTAGGAPKANSDGTLEGVTGGGGGGGTSEDPNPINTSGWASSGTVTILVGTHARGLYARGECLMTNGGGKDEIVGCVIERNAAGDLFVTYETKPDKFLVYRGEKTPGATGATGATGPAIGGLLTTKGDSVGYSTLAVRVPVGTNGQVKMADSTQAVGWKWADAPGGVSACAATGTTTLTCTPSPALANGCAIDTTMVLRPASTITGAVTLSATGCTSNLPITRGPTGLVSGELRADSTYLIVRTATGWRLVADDAVPGGSGALTKVYTTSPPTWDVTTGVFPALTGGNTFTGSHDFSGASIFRIPQGTADPTCDASHYGETFLNINANPSVLKICGKNTGGSYTWGTVTVTGW